jgi:hypothetical protein
MKRSEVFESLDPPAGGLARLRARLDRRRSNVRRIAFVAAPVAVAVAALLVIVLGRTRAPDLVASARESGGIDPSALGFAAPPKRFVVAESQSTATLDVPTTDSNVVFVWVGTTQ